MKPLVLNINYFKKRLKFPQGNVYTKGTHGLLWLTAVHVNVTLLSHLFEIVHVS